MLFDITVLQSFSYPENLVEHTFQIGQILVLLSYCYSCTLLN